MINIDIKLQPKQIELYKVVSDNVYSIIGYGGSAGGAKSHAIRDVALIIASEIKQLKILIMRRISTELLDNHINPFFEKYPELRQYFNKTERLLYLPNGSFIKFGSSNDEDEIYSYQGSEFDLIFVDEATHFTQKMIEFLMTRNRTTKAGFKAKTILTMNPGGVGHAYIKRIFVDKSYTDNEIPEDYYFIQAKIYDNVIWSVKALNEYGHSVREYYEQWTDEQRKDFCYKHSEYALRLSKLPYELVEAYLEGNWDVFGGMFFKGFNKKKQTITPFKIPKEWFTVLSVDPGYSSPCSAGLTARDLNGKYYRIATYYEEMKSPEQHLEGVKQWLKDLQTLGIIEKDYDLAVCGLDAWAKKDRYSIMANELTWESVWSAGGIYLTKAVTSRIQGWWTWKGLMPDNYFIFEGYNEPLLSEMTAVLSDNKKVEDIQGGGNDAAVSDHALDEQRYGIMSLFRPREQYIEPVLSERQQSMQPIYEEGFTL